MQKRWIEWGMAALLLLAVWLLSGRVAAYRAVDTAGRPCTVILDAGHGGADPGKVAADGSLEKDINLQIAELTKEKLEKAGIEVCMTREKDEMLHAPGEKQEKKADMRLRCETINASGAVCAVSIHQNSFADPGAKGAQVFYYEASAEGKQFADLMQQSLIDLVDSSNTRVSKSNTSYYLLRKTSIPLIIVECGFMSNPSEAASLQEAATQDKIAEAISHGIQAFLQKTGRGLAEY